MPNRAPEPTPTSEPTSKPSAEAPIAGGSASALPTSLALPELLAQAQRSDFAWTRLRVDVEEHRLYGDGAAGGPVASVLRYAPGARVPYHRHEGYEHVYVLSGSQRDRRGTYRTGTLVINPPGTSHEVFSDDGCIVLLIWERPVVFVEP
jgi:anti-sigma factor ChrR (cupin superfamily)